MATDSREHKYLRNISDLSAKLLHEIKHFFNPNNEAKSSGIRVLRRVGPERAQVLLTEALQ